MTGQELNEMMASGAIKIIKGRLVSTENPKMDYGGKRNLKSTTDATTLEPVKFKASKLTSIIGKVKITKTKDGKDIKPNPRVKNANKYYYDGHKFDSNLEIYMYQLLMKKKIKFVMKHIITLQPGFRNKDGKAIIAIKWKADFYLPDYNMVVDTKGWATEIFKMKLKLFKHMQHKGGYSHIKKLEFPKNKNECLLLSITLK